jgi:flavin reductase (DIM6/NTAB) family NADH-FMN oxidoreductase RutF
MKFDNLEYRKTLGKFVTGVTIITTCEKDGTPRGFTANSFTSVSLEPPLILICIGDFNEGLELFKNSEYFAVNILNEEQVDISNLFAQPVKNKFEEIKWSNSKFGVPIIKGALAWLECKNFDQKRSGDHLILIGNVKNFHNEGGYPLAYYNGNYISFNNETSLVNAMEKDSKTIIGAIIEKNNSILFFDDSKNNILKLPVIGENGEPSNTTKLVSKYSNIGLKMSLDFVYSVYEDKRLDAVCIYYRSKGDETIPKGYKYVKFNDINWEKIKDKALVIMLKRYIEEANQGDFAVYMGNETTGLTQTLK